MSFFPNSFQKVFVVGNVINAAGTTTDQLTPGQLALVNAGTHASVATAGPFPKQAYFALGNNLRTSDKIGQFAGGYLESIKSKGINPRYVNRFIRKLPKDAVSQIVRIGWNGVASAAGDATAPSFVCGQTYNLRVDVKGGPVLRALQRNAYKTVSAFTGCCANPATPSAVDPATVLITFAKELNSDLIMKNFIRASVVVKVGAAAATTLTTDAQLDGYVAGTPADIKAALVLTVVYGDTTFSNCTWEKFDHFELDPVQVTAAQLVDESGQPCSNFKQLLFAETTAPVIAQGTGEHYIREVILSSSYLQDFLRDDKRKQEVEGYIATNIINKSLKYKAYHLIHSVPRFNNPTSTFDNDQYMLTFVFPAAMDTTAFEALVNAFIATGNTGVTLETGI
jgi:hypothetical protein